MSRKRHASILQDVAQAGVYHAPPSDLAELLAVARISGFSIRRINLGQVVDKAALLDRLKTEFEFPDWFGQSWDALADCLADLSWLPARGYLLLLEHCDVFRARHAEDFSIALSIFAAAADAWRQEGIPFWVLADSQAEGIDSLPVLE